MDGVKNAKISYGQSDFGQTVCAESLTGEMVQTDKLRLAVTDGGGGWWNVLPFHLCNSATWYVHVWSGGTGLTWHVWNDVRRLRVLPVTWWQLYLITYINFIFICNQVWILLILICLIQKYYTCNLFIIFWYIENKNSLPWHAEISASCHLHAVKRRKCDEVTPAILFGLVSGFYNTVWSTGAFL